MLRKLLAATIFIVFSLILILIEVSITLPVDASGSSYNGVNLFNRIVLSVLAVGLFVYEIYPYSRKISNKKHRLLYMALSSAIIVVVAIMWMILFTWK